MEQGRGVKYLQIGFQLAAKAFCHLRHPQHVIETMNRILGVVPTLSLLDRWHEEASSSRRLRIRTRRRRCRNPGHVWRDRCLRSQKGNAQPIHRSAGLQPERRLVCSLGMSTTYGPPMSEHTPYPGSLPATFECDA